MSDSKPTTSRLGILSALAEEQAGLIEAMDNTRREQRGMRSYTCGTLWGQPTVCVLARLGKVAAATTVTTLIERYGVTHLLFTGVAGAVGAGLKPGDVVIADTLVQHDMDASPLFPRFEIPLLGRALFSADAVLSERLAAAAGEFLQTGPEHSQQKGRPQLRRGLVASGDEFVHSGQRVAALRAAFADLQAVEMEGAAVAQVCHEYGLPFAVLRTISDSADETAPQDFMHFVRDVAAPYSFGIVRRLLTAGPIQSG
jgi:adenosylhomocysteine nucleosidase